jgi:1-aminocyclopropane-1-carboxylate deaminase/D-cysteine desulfhydrase-like pyridoxal-dependent ACC family enzyme
MIFQISPFHKSFFQNREFYLKRDDLLHQDFSGNKARKFHYFLEKEFLHVKRVVSYGSNQSNAMYSLSVLAKMKNWEFIYFCDHIPTFLKQNPVGNYKAALQNGMKIFETTNRAFRAQSLKDEDTLVIEEGGRQKEAEFGLKFLAYELQKDIEENGLQKPFVFLPSGTGTTALFLQKYLSFPVFTCSTVGDEEYLKKQWEMIEENKENFPKILTATKKYHYGKLNLELYELWRDLKNQTNVEFDLMYDVVGWKKLLENWQNLDGDLIYIHQGGIKGNESMLQRYKYKYDIIDL